MFLIEADFTQTKIAGAQADAELAGFGSAGAQVDDAADGIGTVEGGARAFEDFDAGDGFERGGGIEIKMAGLDVVEAHAVEEDKCLAEAGAANGEICLEDAGAALAEVDGGVVLKKVEEGLEEEALGGGERKGCDVAVGFGERDGGGRAGDDDGFFCGGRLGGLDLEEGNGE